MTQPARKRPRDDLTSVLARLQQMEAGYQQQSQRIAALENIIASRFKVIPPALAANTITPKQAADELGLSTARVSQLIAKGKLRATRIGGRQYVDVASVQSLKI